MKRSEMEHRVKEWLLTNGGTQTVDIPELLDFLVSQGMQPPSYVNGYFTAPYLGCDSADVEWVEETVNDWEPE